MEESGEAEGRQKGEREPQRPQSHPVTAPTPWPVSKSTLQAFSILAPYFSVLLIYRFIVHQPVWRPLNLAHPLFHPPTRNNSSILFYTPPLSPLCTRSHLWSTRNDARPTSLILPSVDPQVFWHRNIDSHDALTGLVLFSSVESHSRSSILLFYLRLCVELTQRILDYFDLQSTMNREEYEH